MTSFQTANLAKIQAPFPDGFVGENHAPHRQDFLNITKAQREAEI
jgi:hypothetical protein